MNKPVYRNSVLPLPIACLSLLVISCTWVKPAEEAENVVVVEARHVSQCDRLGITSANVRDRVAFFDRSEGKVAEELATLAKNSAVSMGGDTLVANSEIVDGSQEFIVYRCN